MKTKSEKKLEYSTFRLSTAELRKLTDLSKRCGIPRSSFVNRAILDTMRQIESKKTSKSERTFVEMCRFILGKD